MPIWIFKIAEFIIRIIPLRAGMCACGLLSLAVSIFLPRRWRIALSNVKRAFPERSPFWRLSVVLKHFYHLGRFLFFNAKAMACGEDFIRKNVSSEGDELYHRSKSSSTGVILLTAHIGNWESAGMYHSLFKNPIVTVGRPVHWKTAGRLLVKLRNRLRMVQYPYHGSFFHLAREVKNGRDIAILPDHNTPGNAVFVDFFGTPASYSRSPYLLAKRSGAPVMVAFSHFEGTQLKIEYLLTLPVNTTTEGFYFLYSQALERYIMRHPEQYLWLHDRWRARPSDERSS